MRLVQDMCIIPQEQSLKDIYEPSHVKIEKDWCYELFGKGFGGMFSDLDLLARTRKHQNSPIGYSMHAGCILFQVFQPKYLLT